MFGYGISCLNQDKRKQQFKKNTQRKSFSKDNVSSYSSNNSKSPLESPENKHYRELIALQKLRLLKEKKLINKSEYEERKKELTNVREYL
jgi:hypothetical protein